MNHKITHYIITRFMNNMNLGYGAKIFDKEILRDSSKYLNYNLIKSLENQTDLNFELLVVIHDNNDSDFIKSLIKTSLVFHVIKNKDLNNYIRKHITGDFLITTRIDYDDFIKNNAVSECKQKFVDFFNVNYNTLFCVNGYHSGLSCVDTKFYVMNKHYSSGGFFSAFVSLCYNLKCLTSPDDIVSVYFLGDHTKLFKGIENLICHLNIHDCKNITKYIDDKETEKYNYIWYRHKNTGSELLHYTPADTSTEVLLDADFVNRRFGLMQFI